MSENMISDFQKSPKSLYNIDYNLWVEQTVEQLRSQDFNNTDWENLIEEIASLGRNEKRVIKILLTRLFENLLKLTYWESARSNNQNYWQREILNARKQIRDNLITSPSLKRCLTEFFEESYQDARELVSIESELSLDTFPTLPIGSPKQILDKNWLP